MRNPRGLLANCAFGLLPPLLAASASGDQWQALLVLRRLKRRGGPKERPQSRTSLLACCATACCQCHPVGWSPRARHLHARRPDDVALASLPRRDVQGGAPHVPEGLQQGHRRVQRPGGRDRASERAAALRSAQKELSLRSRRWGATAAACRPASQRSVWARRRPRSIAAHCPLAACLLPPVALPLSRRCPRRRWRRASARRSSSP
jgi:hypothetical protein